MTSKSGPPKRGSKRLPTDVDRQVARNIRHYRNRLGMTLVELAGGIGVSAQQVQKYESGASRVSASMLLCLSEVLEVGIEDFFAGTKAQPARAPSKLELARSECRVWINRTKSLATLNSMARVLKAIASDD
jgi:transcriptional regulator with XRE-family HTH domain